MTDELKPVRCGCGGEAIYGKWVSKVGVIAHAVGCKNCGIQTKPYPTEAEAVTAWNTAMGTNTRSLLEVLAHDAEERTAKVEKVDMNSPHSQVYKCCKCGQYTHRTAWSRDVVYCPSCGARLERE